MSKFENPEAVLASSGAGESLKVEDLPETCKKPPLAASAATKRSEPPFHAPFLQPADLPTSHRRKS